jgi:hypothetical protein
MHLKTSLALAAILALSVFAVAAGSATKASAQVNEKNVDFATNVEFVRGHLEKAILNKEAGNNSLAAAHAGHPVAELYPSMTAEIKEHDKALDGKLDAELNNLFSNIASMSVDQTKSRVAGINIDLDAATKAVVSPSERNDTSFWARVTIGLLDQSVDEYSEGVSGGKIAQEVEYQDAGAFIHRAEVIFAKVKASMPAEEAGKAQDLFGQLDTLVKRPANPDEVKTTIDGVVHEIQEGFKIEPKQESKLNGQQYIDKINELLDQSMAEYKKGNFDQAKALAREAYLDNYENIESDIAKDNKDLMQKIEVNMRVNLVTIINDKKPVAEVQAQVDQIKTDLQTARAVVAPEFPVAALAASLGIAGTVAYGRLRGFRRA